MVLTLVVKAHNYWLCLCAVSALCNYSFIIITIIFVFFFGEVTPRRSCRFIRYYYVLPPQSTVLNNL